MSWWPATTLGRTCTSCGGRLSGGSVRRRLHVRDTSPVLASAERHHLLLSRFSSVICLSPCSNNYWHDHDTGGMPWRPRAAAWDAAAPRSRLNPLKDSVGHSVTPLCATSSVPTPARRPVHAREGPWPFRTPHHARVRCAARQAAALPPRETHSGTLACNHVSSLNHPPLVFCPTRTRLVYA